MGKFGDWTRVLLNGAIWIFLMVLLSPSKSRGANTRPPLLGTNIWMWFLLGLSVGLINVFSGKAFQRPLVYLTIATTVGGFVAGWVSRHPRESIPQ